MCLVNTRVECIQTVLYPVHPQGLSYSLQSPPRSEHSAHTRHSVTFLDGLHTHDFSTFCSFFLFQCTLLPVFSLPQRTSQMQFQFHTFRSGGFHSQLLCKLLQSLVRSLLGNLFRIMTRTPGLHPNSVLSRPLGASLIHWTMWKCGNATYMFSGRKGKGGYEKEGGLTGGLGTLTS